jgi:UDP:flavonoid glycosyltransferase YjiC (YdhE family)
MYLSIVAVGSRGDVQPYIALGLGLQRAGFQVQICADRVHRLACGPHPIPFARLNEENLADAIDRAVNDPTLRRNAKVLADRLQMEDGVGKAVRYIQAFLETKENFSKVLL